MNGRNHPGAGPQKDEQYGGNATGQEQRVPHAGGAPMISVLECESLSSFLACECQNGGKR
jgi:hypothetical protein